MNVVLDPCEICGNANWHIQYRGKIREGGFGSLTQEDGTVGKCSRCGVERLDEASCKDETFYGTEDYRNFLREPKDAAGFFLQHDETQLRNLTFLWPESLRNRVVADIGCAAGSFLDHVSGIAGNVVSVEPCRGYHESLKERGYHVYPYAADAVAEWGGRIDFAFCFSVIEHVRNPRLFLEEVRKLLSPQGKLIVSTPNRRDILMELKGEVYRRFFYRAVHRWYFDAESFAYCGRKAGFRLLETRWVHRFGLSNAMAWLRDGRPTGSAPLPHLDSPHLDAFWKAYLESRGVSDYLYFKLTIQDS